MMQQVPGDGSFSCTGRCRYNNQHRKCLNSFNRSAEAVEPFVNILITAIDLVDILNNTFPLRAHGGDEQRNTRPDIGTAHRDATQFVQSSQSDHRSAMGIAKNDLCTHIEKLVYKEQAAFKHFLMNEYTAFSLRGNHEHHTQQIRRQSGPWMIIYRQNRSIQVGLYFI